MKVSEIMTAAPTCCCKDEKVQKAANIMLDLNVGIVPIVESETDETLVGLVTDRDLCLRVVALGFDPATTALESCMSEEIISCQADDNVEKVVALMQKHQIRRIPIIDSENHIQGIVSLADVTVRAHEQDIAETITEISEPAGLFHI
jgi:CBS domain-containing protein